MASEDSFLVLVHHRESIKRKTRSGVKFTDKDPLCIIMSPATSYDGLVCSVLGKLGLEGVKRVKKFFYRIPITVLHDTVKYDCFTIGSDEDLQVMFLSRRQFPEVRTRELLAKFVDVVSSSGGSNRNANTIATAAGSSSRPAVASSSVPAVQHVASPSFAVDLAGNVGDEVGYDEHHPTEVQCPPPAGVGERSCDDPDDDEVEPDIIADESGDDVGASDPIRPTGGSSSGTNQYPPHFSSLDLDAMRQDGHLGQLAGFCARDTDGSAGITEFQVGQQFQDKDEALLSVKTYSIRRGVQYKVVESDYHRYVGKCSEFGNGCTWLIRLSLRQRKGIWEVKRYKGPHTCLATSISSDHRSLDYHVIATFIMPMVRADASVNIKVLLNATAAHFGFRPTYRRVWMAKQKAVAIIYGDWDESYNELPRWVLGVQLTMPGTVTVLRTCPVRVGGQVDESQAYFHRMFWTFPPCIEAFRHCKPLVSIDGTHLYGKYGGTLLVAIAQDGNSNILPVAFALVEGENAESWSFFLSHLRQHVTPQPGLLVISDRHNGIKAALEAPDGGWLPPSAYRAFCIRHVAANFALTFKGKDARRLLVNTAYAKTEVEFDYWFDILRSENPAMCDWANRIDYSLWTQYCDEGRRFGHMTTNISECVNSILKGVRNLPVCSLVKATYGRLAELFVRKGREAEAQMGTGQQFSQYLVKCIEANLKTARCFTVTVYDRDNSEYTVAETTPTGSFSLGTYRVSLGSKTCDCGYFQALHFPCPHALSCCAYSRLTWQPYVHQVYRLSSVFGVYQMGFTPPIPEGFWPPYAGPSVIPDPNMRRAREGRPRSTRIRTNMDDADPNRPKRCGFCRQPGHTRRSCPQAAGPSGTAGN
ncbi:uncharacterized protein LOC130945758 [Arachis stenosperma]|uniref:uncharacterized protein LOC130945758 n=1 Tax=Arachis stenosperma TaxID=217475 RepID=UPI0025AC83A2|nr:uncharacterized protein LOC130945758 [Arachis stenosperma]